MIKFLKRMFCLGGFWQGGFLSGGSLCLGGFCPRTNGKRVIVKIDTGLEVDALLNRMGQKKMRERYAALANDL